MSTATKHRPTLADALGCLQAGRDGEASAICEEVLRSQPRQPEALFLLGLVAQRGRAHEQALAFFARAIAAKPGTAVFHVHRGNSYRALNRPTEAVAAYDAALRLNPALADAHQQRGNALKQLARWSEAAASLAEATRLAPRDSAAWLNRGVAHLELRETDLAIECFLTATRLEPNRSEAYNILAVALTEKGCPLEARLVLHEALRLKPGFAAALDNLGRTFRIEGRMPEAAECFRAALAQRPDPQTHSNLLYALNFLPDATPAEIFAEHRRWQQRHAAALAPAVEAWSNAAVPDRRLRVGFVSADFCAHAVACFFEPVLEHGDREHFEFICYSDVAVPDDVTRRLRSRSDGWREIAGVTDERAAAMIREDRIDILVDLAGHTAGNRLRMFARKPAPVQVSWIGYPNTTGLDAIGYRLTDEISDPIGASDSWHSEALVRLPGAFSCYRPPEASPAVGPLPAFEHGHVTFGCFNHIAKLSEPTLALWAKLLARVPDARLYLKSRGLGEPATAARIRAVFAGHGVAPDRLELDGRVLSVAAHLEVYRSVDVALDPFPYHGTTTTCEALWMGVPVVTLAGQTHVGRVGASLLTHLGEPSWIARDPDEYVSAAVRLASDLPALAATRSRLRKQFVASPICDGARLMRGVEAAWRAMWQRWCGEQDVPADARAPVLGRTDE